MGDILFRLAIVIDGGDIGYDTGIRKGETGLGQILTLAYAWAGIIAVIILIVAGYLFVTARGNAEQMKRAKDAIRGAVIGLIVVAMAFAITRLIIGGVR